MSKRSGTKAAVKWNLNRDVDNGWLPEYHMVILCFWESTSYIAEATNLSFACSVSLLYNQNSAFKDDGIAHLIRCCHFFLNPKPTSFSARQLTTLALLIPRVWWTTPPVIPSCHYECHNSSLHIFQSGFGVSFTLNPAFWLGHVKSASQSDKHTLICLCWINSGIHRLWRRLHPYTFCFFSCNKAICATTVMPLRDMTV